LLYRIFLNWQVQDKTGVPVFAFREQLPDGAPLPRNHAVGDRVRFLAKGRRFEAEVMVSFTEYSVDDLNNVECNLHLQATEI
jgi:predicted lysophospholipase L1 biosynthesis ABC-type transport system permease subunit